MILYKNEVLLEKNYNMSLFEILQMPFYEYRFKCDIIKEIEEEQEEANKKEEAKNAIDYKSMTSGIKMPDFNSSMPKMPDLSSMPKISGFN